MLTKMEMISKFEIRKSEVKGKKTNIESLIKIAQKVIKKEFSPSFIQWLNEFGEDVWISNGKGNFSTNKLLPQNKKEEITSVTEGAKALKSAGWPINEEFIPFGSDGGENIFAFYTRFSKNKEYPVVLVSLDFKKSPYVLMSSSFSNFVNTYVNIEILRKDLDKSELRRKAEEFVGKYESGFDVSFAEQLVSWNWSFISLQELNNKLEKLKFEKGGRK